MPAGAPAGPASFTATASYAGQPSAPPPAHARGQVPCPQLSAAFNEEAITADGDTSVLADMYGSQTYSAQALASAGLPPGGQVSHDGLTFTFPSVASGRFDNAASMGQTIKIGAAGHMLGLLVAGMWGTQAGAFTVTYTDGTSQQTLLEAPDWQDTTAPGAVGTAAYINNVSTGSTVSQKASIFYVSIPLNPGATVAYLTLPGNSRSTSSRLPSAKGITGGALEPTASAPADTAAATSASVRSPHSLTYLASTLAAGGGPMRCVSRRSQAEYSA